MCSIADATIQVLDIFQSANQFEKLQSGGYFIHVSIMNMTIFNPEFYFRQNEQPGDQTAAPGQAAPEVSCRPQLRPPEDGLQ